MSGTTSPLQILPQFVEVLGKKIDKIRSEQDVLKCQLGCVLGRIDSRRPTLPQPFRPLAMVQKHKHDRLRLSEGLGKQCEKMQSCYDSLTTALSEATVHPESMDKKLNLSSCMHPCVNSRNMRADIQKLFVNCAKLDVALNAMLMRSKPLGALTYAVGAPN